MAGMTDPKAQGQISQADIDSAGAWLNKQTPDPGIPKAGPTGDPGYHDDTAKAWLVGKYNAAKDAAQMIAPYTRGAQNLASNIVKGMPGVSSYEAYKNNNFDYSPIANVLAEHVPALKNAPPAAKAGYAMVDSIATMGLGGAIGKTVGGALEGPAMKLVGGMATALEKVGMMNEGGLAEETLAGLAQGETVPTEEEIGALGKTAARQKLAAHTITGAAAGGVFGSGMGGLNAAAHHPANMASNIALGALFGAVGGAYGANTMQRISQKMPDLVGMLSKDHKEGFDVVDGVAGHLTKKAGLSPRQAVSTTLRVAQGAGSDADRLTVQYALKENPRLLETKAGQKMFQIANRNASPTYLAADGDYTRMKYTTPNGVEKSIDIRGKIALDHYINLARQGMINPTELEAPPEILQKYADSMRHTNMDFPVPPEAELNESLDAMEKPDAISSFFAGQTHVMPREQLLLGHTITLPDLSHENPLDGPITSAVQYSEPTMAGTGVAVPGAEAVLPALQPGLPDATVLRQPDGLKPLQKDIFTLAQGTDWEALEKKLGSRAANDHLKTLTVGSILRPDDVTHPDVAQFLGGTLQDFVPEGKENDPKFAPLMEKAVAFQNRAFELRGTQPPKAWTPELTGMFERGEDGDIVRKLDNHDGSVSLVDSEGRSAKMRSTDAPAVTPQIVENIPELGDSADAIAEGSKKIEAVFGDGASEPIEVVHPRAGEYPSQTETHLEDILRYTKLAVADIGKVPLLQAKLALVRDVMSPAGYKTFQKNLLDLVHEDVEETDPAAEFAADKAYVEKKFEDEQARLSGVKKNLMNMKLKAALKSGKPDEELRSAATADRFANIDEQLKHGERPDSAKAKKFAALAKQLKAAFTGFEKGSIARGKLPRVKSGLLGDLAKKSGTEVYQRENNGGFVLVAPDGSRMFAKDQIDAANQLLDFAKRGRVVAEQQQMLNRDSIPLPNVNGLLPQLEIAKKLSEGESGRPAPVMRPGRRGLLNLKMKQGNLALELKKQRAILEAMGPEGRKQSMMHNNYHATMEMMNAHDYRAVYAAIHKLKKAGYTISQIGSNQIPEWAQKMYRENVKSVLDEHQRNAHIFGIAADDVVDSVYAPHIFRFKPEDLSDHVVTEVQEKLASVGINADTDHAVAYLNDPEQAAQGGFDKSASAADQRSGMLPPKGMSDEQRADILRWLRNKRANIAGTLEKTRRGNAGYIEDPEEAVMIAIASRNRRLAEAAVYGPHLEKLNASISALGGNPSVMTDSQMIAQRIANDVRGRTYNPQGQFQRGMMNMARGSLVLSAPRHLAQLGLLATRNPVRTTAATFDTMLHFVRENRLAKDVGVIARKSLWDITEKDAIDTGDHEQGHLGKMAETIGKAGSLPLHGTINTIRTIANNVGRHEFDGYLKAAMKGNKKALAMMSEVLETKITPETLQSINSSELKAALKDRYGKALADKVGYTFRPQDMPLFARSNMGKWLLQFRQYMWQTTQSWQDALFNKNIPIKTRAARAARAAIIMPAISAVVANIYHKAHADTIDGMEMIRAIDYAQRDPNMRTLLNLELQSAINTHALGQLSDIVQGMNTGDKDIMIRGIVAEPASGSEIANAAYAAACATSYLQNRDPKMKEAAYNSAASFFGTGGLAINRMYGRSKPPRVPKHNVVLGN